MSGRFDYRMRCRAAWCFSMWLLLSGSFLLHALPVGQTLYDATFGGRTFVSVGANGTIYSSGAGGGAWAQRTSGVTNDLRTVTYGAGVFVAAGDDGVLLSSTDGSQWTIRSLPALLRNPDSAWGNGRFVVMGKGPAGEWTALVSTNGADWFRIAVEAPGPSFVPEGLPFGGVAFGNGEFRAAGGVQRANLVLSSTDGMAWKEIGGGTGAITGPIASGHGGFALVTEYVADDDDDDDGPSVYPNLLYSAPGTAPSWYSGVPGPSRVPRAIENAECGFLVASRRPFTIPARTDVSILRQGKPPLLVTNLTAPIHGLACGDGACVAVGDDIVPIVLPPLTSVLEINLTALTVPAGASVGFQVTVPCRDFQYTFQWQHDGVDLPLATNQFLSFLAFNTNAGSYTAVAVGPDGVVLTSPSAKLTVVDPDPPRLSAPTILDPTVDVSLPLLAGSSYVLRLNVAGWPPPEIQWKFNGQDLPGANDRVLALPHVDFGAVGRYSARANNALGQAMSAYFNVDVRTAPPRFIGTTNAVSIMEGSAAQLSASYNSVGSPASVIRFVRDGIDQDLPLVAPARLAFRSISLEDAGEYRLIASNSVGVVDIGLGSITVLPSGPLDRWSRRSPSPQGELLHRVVHGDGRFVAVGENGAVLSSADGLDWASRPIAAALDLVALASGNGRFVAAGPGSILNSTDGIHWSVALSRSDLGPLKAATFGNGRFVVAGGSILLTSTDGLNWFDAAFPLGSDRWFRGVAFGNGKFVAVSSASSPPNARIWASDDGVHWMPEGNTPVVDFEDLAFAAGQFLAFGGDGVLYTSLDGQEWTERDSGVSTRLLGITYGDGRYVAVGARGRLLTSPDGVKWKKENSGAEDRLESVTYADGQFIAVGENGTILSSTSGTQWRKRHKGPTRDLDGMTIGDGLIAIVGKGGTIVTTRNGVDLVEQSTGVDDDLHGIAWADGLFVAVGEPGTILTSPDAMQWTRRPVDSTSSLKSVVHGANRWVVVGTQGGLLTSTDGASWIPLSSPTTSDLNSVAYGNGLFVIVGDSLPPDGTLLTSPDGLVWKRRNQYIGKNLRSVAFANGRFVATANDGYFMRSNDGIHWELSYAATPRGLGNLRSIAYGAGLWFLTGNEGAVATSPDLLSWTQHLVPTSENLHSVLHYGGRFLVIGNRGTVLQSDFVVRPPELTAQRTGEQVQLRIAGDAGLTYRVEATEDLGAANWAPLATLTLSRLTGDLPDAVGDAQRFYRVVLLP